MLIPVLLTALAAASVASPEGPDQDGVVTTAPATPPVLAGAQAPVAPEVAAGAGAQSATPHGLSTDQQIAQWLAARSPDPMPAADSSPWRDDRKPHGEFSVGIGTGGYRDYAAVVSLPVGESGRLDISIRQSENDPYRHRYGYGGGYDPYFADSGYAFPGQAAPGAAIGYERHLSRADGPPWVQPSPRSQQPAK
ncbi:hypothetical protein GCM10009116_00250 [Brevundimonas basaltis]|uniref:Uncharacterized protein n=1 Tax=Brevundimonas basaltis TaxID=472166 RepID=A0A7W8I1S5_9CAUL|nr:hypothetical protein [Brevundimonas basaltis]MBB5292952.1 hypothetical protein [Brevundimonas basaltis]